jgi:fucose permease
MNMLTNREQTNDKSPASSAPRSSESTLATFASAAFVMTGVVTTFLGPLLPALSARWQLSDAQAGYFFSAQFLGSIAGGTLTSTLLPRRGFRFNLALGYALMAAGTCGLALAHWRLALAGTFTYGLGLGLAITASNLLISDLNSENRAAALSALNFCWSAGAVLAPFAIAVAERRNLLWGSIETLAAALLLTAMVVWTAPGAASVAAEQQLQTPWRSVCGWRFTAVVAAMFFLYVGTEASLGGWIAALVKRAPGSAALWLPAASMFWGGLALGRGLAPPLLRRAGARTVSLAGLAMAVAATGVLMRASSQAWMVAAASAGGLGLSAVFPITIALLSGFGEKERRVAGPMFALAGLGGAVLPWLVGAVSSASHSLQTGLIVPAAAGSLLLGLHGSNFARVSARSAARVAIHCPEQENP